MMDICTVDRETIASLYQYQYLYRSIEHQLLQPYWVPLYRALYELIFLLPRFTVLWDNHATYYSPRLLELVSQYIALWL